MPNSLADILSWTGGEWVNRDEFSGREPVSILVQRPAQIRGAQKTEIVFFFSKDYQQDLLQSSPGILLTAPPFVEPLKKSGLPLWKSAAVIACADPYYAMALVTGRMASALSSVVHQQSPEKTEIHPSAVVDPSARVGNRVRIGANCVVEKGSEIADGVVLYPGVYIGPQVKIGKDTVIFPRVSVYEMSQIGSRTRIHAGAVIGADGFGYAPKRSGKTVTGHQKIYHTGRVVIGDDVEIGANSCIDRATFGETRIENQAKLDNLVQVGHNAVIGEGTILCGCVAVAGSAEIGRYVYVGGLAGVTNVRVGDGALIAAMTLVSKDVPAGGTAVGNPQREQKEHFRAHATLNRLAEKKSEKKNERKTHD